VDDEMPFVRSRSFQREETVRERMERLLDDVCDEYMNDCCSSVRSAENDNTLISVSFWSQNGSRRVSLIAELKRRYPVRPANDEEYGMVSASYFSEQHQPQPPLTAAAGWTSVASTAPSSALLEPLSSLLWWAAAS